MKLSILFTILVTLVNCRFITIAINETANAIAYDDQKIIEGFHVFVPTLEWNEYLLVKATTREIESTNYYYIFATLNPEDPEASQSAAFTKSKTIALVQLVKPQLDSSFFILFGNQTYNSKGLNVTVQVTVQQVTAQTTSTEGVPSTIETTIVNDYFSVVAYQFSLSEGLYVYPYSAIIDLNAVGAPHNDPTYYCSGIISSTNNTWINTAFPTHVASVQNNQTIGQNITVYIIFNAPYPNVKAHLSIAIAAPNPTTGSSSSGASTTGRHSDNDSDAKTVIAVVFSIVAFLVVAVVITIAVFRWKRRHVGYSQIINWS